ncbi:hypothetical protein E4U57_003693 [Claviceps arundinis]|uniref:Uncharacterized protein n=1 Tax=Claviceps arundinis TaxID=1623583 RepID=A0ABQ7P6C2_9HYPO|nr:hypothetical protein E4U57_003693 [Claviceps arundinis]
MESTLRSLPQPDFGIIAKGVRGIVECFIQISEKFVEDIDRLVRSVDALTEQMAALRQETRQEFETTQLNMAAFQEEFRAGLNALKGDTQRGFAEMGTEIQVSSVHDGDVLHEGAPLPFRPR